MSSAYELKTSFVNLSMFENNKSNQQRCRYKKMNTQAQIPETGLIFIFKVCMGHKPLTLRNIRIKGLNALTIVIIKQYLQDSKFNGQLLLSPFRDQNQYGSYQ